MYPSLKDLLTEALANDFIVKVGCALLGEFRGEGGS